ncbi:MAG: hypothetical protein JRH07_19285 [Deltaproteobacteria bacterium]|nr:hypothetical protein [Deltaproteobacteria bacterium]
MEKELSRILNVLEEQVQLTRQLLRVTEDSVAYAKRRDALIRLHDHQVREEHKRDREEHRKEALFHRERIEEMRRRERAQDKLNDALDEVRAIMFLRGRGFTVTRSPKTSTGS